LFDCCLETDGTAAVVVTPAERARFERHAGYIMGVAEGRPTPPTGSPMKDVFPIGLTSRAARVRDGRSRR
jgi:hypothetical protein